VIPRENIEISERIIQVFGGKLELMKCEASKGNFPFVFAKPLQLQAWLTYGLEPTLRMTVWNALAVRAQGTF
jgi:hypothetical protein